MFSPDCVRRSRVRTKPNNLPDGLRISVGSSLRGALLTESAPPAAQQNSARRPSAPIQARITVHRSCSASYFASASLIAESKTAYGTRSEEHTSELQSLRHL